MSADQERLEGAIEAAFTALKLQYGGVRNDYYGLIFFEKVLGVKREQALSQVAFGNSDLGIDGFHFDLEECVFRIFQFKNSKDGAQLHASMRRLAEAGIPALFDRSPTADHQTIVDNARRELEKAAPSLQRVQVDFCFRGDVGQATSGELYPALQDDIVKHSWRFGELTKRDELPMEVRVYHLMAYVQSIRPNNIHSTLKGMLVLDRLMAPNCMSALCP